METVNNKQIVFTAQDMKDYASFLRGCNYECYSDNKWYYEVDKILIPEDEIFDYWIDNHYTPAQPTPTVNKEQSIEQLAEKWALRYNNFEQASAAQFGFIAGFKVNTVNEESVPRIVARYRQKQDTRQEP